MDALGIARACRLLVAHEVVEAGMPGTLQHHLAAELRGWLRCHGRCRLRLAGGASNASTPMIPNNS